MEKINFNWIGNEHEDSVQEFRYDDIKIRAQASIAPCCNSGLYPSVDATLYKGEYPLCTILVHKDCERHFPSRGGAEAWCDSKANVFLKEIYDYLKKEIRLLEGLKEELEG